MSQIDSRPCEFIVVTEHVLDPFVTLTKLLGVDLLLVELLSIPFHACQLLKKAVPLKADRFVGDDGQIPADVGLDDHGVLPEAEVRSSHLFRDETGLWDTVQFLEGLVGLRLGLSSEEALDYFGGLPTQLVFLPFEAGG